MPLLTPLTNHFVLSRLMFPKRSELSWAIGLAPIVNISLLIPPTPVAAPWYGSSAEGWLWDSILKQHAKPSPISTRPAFSSPASTNIWGPSFGNFFNHTIEFL